MRLDPTTLDSVADVLREAAEFEVMSRFGKLSKEDIHDKGERGGHRDVATTADLESERRIREGLRAINPAIPMIGEEEAAKNPDILKLLNEPGPVWVVDPLDGTRNFVSGKPCFALIIALVEGGETRAGWIYDPIGDVMVWAGLGEGAWMGEKRLKLAPAPAIDAMTGSLGPKRGAKWASKTPNLPNAAGTVVRYGCVGREYIDLALGKVHFAHYGGHLMAWDHAAGVLFHNEAGGYGAMTSHESPYRPAASQHKGDELLLAPDRQGWQGVHERLFAG